MSEMVERCTDAFWDAIPDGVYIEGPFDAHTVIRAVIKAMREPTKEMTSAACADTMLCTIENGEITFRPHVCWRAMIDAALT